MVPSEVEQQEIRWEMGGWVEWVEVVEGRLERWYVGVCGVCVLLGVAGGGWLEVEGGWFNQRDMSDAYLLLKGFRPNGRYR